MRTTFAHMKWIGLLLWWLLLLGLVLPYLMSEPATTAVILGFVVLFASAYLTFRVLRAHFEKEPAR